MPVPSQEYDGCFPILPLFWYGGAFFSVVSFHGLSPSWIHLGVWYICYEHYWTKLARVIPRIAQNLNFYKWWSHSPLGASSFCPKFCCCRQLETALKNIHLGHLHCHWFHSQAMVQSWTITSTSQASSSNQRQSQSMHVDHNRLNHWGF